MLHFLWSKKMRKYCVVTKYGVFDFVFSAVRHKRELEEQEARIPWSTLPWVKIMPKFFVGICARVGAPDLVILGFVDKRIFPGST
ncbi:MAG: hypothetical protein ACTJLK_04035 [Anaplasma sp.]